MISPIMPENPVERIRHNLVGLRMPRALEALGGVIQQLERGQLGAIEAIDILLAEEITVREGRRIKAALQVARLATTIVAVLEAAIVARGSTLGDQQYRDVLGEVGHYQLEHRVYGRKGLPCPTCGAPVERVQLGAKSAYQCRKCQH